MRGAVLAILAPVLLTLALLAPRPGAALTFNFVTQPGDTLSPDQAGAFNAAAAAWSAALADDVAVTLQVGFTAALPSNVLGATRAAQAFVAYPFFRTHLAQDATTAADAQAVASLPPGLGAASVVVTTAQAKALGYAVAPGASDGAIEFNAGFKFATARDAAGRVAADAFDLIGIAEHEIGHLLGFISNLDSHYATTANGASTEARSALDLFRFAAPGARSYASGAAAGFSLDGGATTLAPFATGASNQASHWASGFQVGGRYALLDPDSRPGQVLAITPLDALALDVIGWNATPVPEPASALLLAPAVLAALVRRRGTQRP